MARSQLYASSRLHINFFQPSFKQTSKIRDGARVHHIYVLLARPYDRLLVHNVVERGSKRTNGAVQKPCDCAAAVRDPACLAYIDRKDDKARPTHHKQPTAPARSCVIACTANPNARLSALYVRPWFDSVDCTSAQGSCRIKTTTGVHKR